MADNDVRGSVITYLDCIDQMRRIVCVKLVYKALNRLTRDGNSGIVQGNKHVTPKKSYLLRRYEPFIAEAALLAH